MIVALLEERVKVKIGATIQHSYKLTVFSSSCFLLPCHTDTDTESQSSARTATNVLNFEKCSVKVSSVDVPTFSSLPSYDGHQDYYEGK